MEKVSVIIPAFNNSDLTIKCLNSIISQSYQNIEMNPHIGLIFFIPGLNETLRINGKAKILSVEEVEKWNLSLEVSNADDNSKILQGVLVEVQEAYGHCPRAFNFSKLWDVKNIQQNNRTSCTLN